jgi:hypothetical protein
LEFSHVEFAVNSSRSAVRLVCCDPLAIEKSGHKGDADFVEKMRQFPLIFVQAIGTLSQMIGELKRQGDNLLKAIPEKSKLWTNKGYFEALVQSPIFQPDRSLLDYSVALTEHLPDISDKLSDLARQCEGLCECARETGLVPKDFLVSSETARLRCLNRHLTQTNSDLKEELRRMAEDLARVNSVVDRSLVPVRERNFSFALREEVRRVRDELTRWWNNTDTITRILDGTVDWSAMEEDQTRKDEELAILRKVWDDVKTINDTLKEDAKLFQQKSQLEAKNSQLQDVNKHIQLEVDALRKENKGLKSDVDALQKAGTKWNQTKEKMTAEVKKLRQDNAALQRGAAGGRGRPGGVPTGALQDAAAQNEELNRMAFEIERYRVIAQEDSEQLEKMKRETKPADVRIEAGNAKIAGLEERTGLVECEIRRMRTQLATAVGELKEKTRQSEVADREARARERQHQEQIQTMSRAVRNQMIAVTQQAEWRIARLKEIHAREVALQQGEIERIHSLLAQAIARLGELGSHFPDPD